MTKESRTTWLPMVVLPLAWLIPGAGHACLGRYARAAIIFVTVSATFWAGIALGGVMTVDPRTERWWFLAEMLAGGYGLVSWERQEQEIRRVDGDALPPMELDDRLAEKNLALVAPMDTVARAYSGVAGLLNLLCIFDAVLLSLMGARGEPPPPAREPPAKA